MRRKIVWGAVFAAVLLFAAWMLWPRSLAADLGAEDSLRAFVITTGIEIVREDGVPSSRPANEIETYRDIAADSEVGTALRNVLDGFSYHLCLDSLTGKQDLSDIGFLQVNLYTQDDWDLKVFNGTGKCFLNGRIVKLGGRGREDAPRLCEALAAALRTTEAVS